MWREKKEKGMKEEGRDESIGASRRSGRSVRTCFILAAECVT